MKTIIALSLFAFSAVASAETIVDCQVSEIIDGNVYEESLSVEEYPDVSVEQTKKGLTLDVGGTRTYEQADGDRIEIDSLNPKYIDYTAAYKEDNFENPVTISVDRNQRTIRKNGKVTKYRHAELYKEDVLVAILRCK